LPDSLTPGLLTPGLSIIYARSLNHCIGTNGGLPWSLPDEYAHFLRVIKGCPIIMGRRSYEDHEGAIPGSLNIVVTGNPDIEVPEDIQIAANLEQAIDIAAETYPNYFVIGGTGLITEALPQANVVFETVVDAHIDGDTFLPPFDYSAWKTREIASRVADNSHAYDYSAYIHSKLR
tara:strand:+ start:1883 stop:2410 length:528 start_codon:yes stop_codon:yes gene_type:complete